MSYFADPHFVAVCGELYADLVPGDPQPLPVFMHVGGDLIEIGWGGLMPEPGTQIELPGRYKLVVMRLDREASRMLVMVRPSDEPMIE